MDSSPKAGGQGRRTDEVTRARLDAIQGEYRQLAQRNWDAIQMFARRTFTILLVLTAITAGAGVLSIYLLGQNTKRASEAHLLALQIQQERRQATFRSCSDQNQRHDETLMKLRTVVGAIKNPAEKAQAERNISGTIALIEALVPRRDCRKLVERTVHTDASTNPDG